MTVRPIVTIMGVAGVAKRWFASPFTLVPLRNRQKPSDRTLPSLIKANSMNLVQQAKKKQLSEKQENFLTALFESNGNFNQAAEIAGMPVGLLRGYATPSRKSSNVPVRCWRKFPQGCK